MNDIRITDDAIEIGELHENGEFYVKWDVAARDVDTEQKILAWVFHLSMKDWIDQYDIHSFIEGCVKIHPTVDICLR